MDDERVQFLERLLGGCSSARETLGPIPAFAAAPLLAEIEVLERRIESELAELRRRPQPWQGDAPSYGST
jgi:hypothetical protein